jgi:hypothetical protein
MLCGISCELAGSVHWPIVDSVHDSRLRPKQTLVSYTLAKPAKLNFFKTPTSAHIMYMYITVILASVRISNHFILRQSRFATVGRFITEPFFALDILYIGINTSFCQI